MRSASPPSNTASEMCGTLAEPGREPRETKPAASSADQMSRTRLSPAASKQSSSASVTLSAYPCPECSAGLNRLTEAGKTVCIPPRMTSERPDAGEEIVLAFKQLLQAMRAEVEGMDEAALGWTPAPDTTPTSNLVLHVLGALSVHLSVLAGAPHERDRDAEFSAAPLPAAELFNRIADAERDVERLRL